MNAIPIPANYGSLEDLSNWLKVNLPHEYHIDGGARWVIYAGHRDRNRCIEFARASDVTFFNLKWPH